MFKKVREQLRNIKATGPQEVLKNGTEILCKILAHISPRSVDKSVHDIKQYIKRGIEFKYYNAITMADQ